MSPRAALRLEMLGFQVLDYVPGKADWLARGRPSEGTVAGRKTIGQLARHDVVTCRLTDRASDARERIEASPYPFGLVLGDNDVLLGRVRLSAIPNSSATVEAAMEPGPSTVRPDLLVEAAAERMRQHNLTTLIVTDPEGRLLGVVRRDDVLETQ